MSDLACRRTVPRIVAMLALAAAATACGYKGPLYLPSDAPAGRRDAGQPQQTPPAPESPAQR